MPLIKVTTREGRLIQLDGETDLSVMENIRDGGVDELLAICGGCMSCATCHVYVEPSVMALLPAMTDDEAFLLESTGVREENSRLSCQIVMTAALDGIAVTIAPEE